MTQAQAEVVVQAAVTAGYSVRTFVNGAVWKVAVSAGITQLDIQAISTFIVSQGLVGTANEVVVS